MNAIEEDRDLECIHKANDSEKLRKLQRKLKDEPGLPRKEGKEFKRIIDTKLKEVGWEGAAKLTTDDRAHQ